MIIKPQVSLLKRGWTTGSCATAASKAACIALFTGDFPDPVSIHLPRGGHTDFTLAYTQNTLNYAQAGVIKDAGDDPDVTHGALIVSTVKLTPNPEIIQFIAGRGVGTVTKAGLPLAIGEPAINPVPRAMMTEEMKRIFQQYNYHGGAEITISVDNGAELAKHTWNPRLGIIGGISILGTTGIVIPFSCAAWIASIHQGIDVCRANHIQHAFACTGSTSETGVRQLYKPADEAMIDMGDFAGGMLKYLSRHPIPTVTIAGGFAKISKLAAGFLDLHSGRSQIDRPYLAKILRQLSGSSALQQKALEANSALEIMLEAEKHQLPLANAVASDARQIALDTAKRKMDIEILIFDRQAHLIGRSSLPS